MSVKDWRPDREPPRQRGDVKIQVIGNLGDANPLDYEGLIVYELWDDDLYYVEAEYWNAPEYDSGPYWVYRFSVENDVFMDLSWVKDWDRVARYAGILPVEFWRAARSRDPLDRAQVYRIVGEYHGWENIDSDPEKYTREEMEKRWPEYA